MSVQGGLNVTVATTEVASNSGSTTAVGGTIAAATTAPAGTVTITATAAPTTAGNFQMGAITVYGGTVVSITEIEAGSAGFTTTGGNVTVFGGASTTSVTVDQTAPVAASATVAGVIDGQVTITDANYSGGAKLGVITTVSLDGLNGANTINDSALANLTVSDAAAGTILNINEGGFSSPVTTLALSLNNDAGLTLKDAGNKYTTVNVTLGAAPDTLTLNDTALTTLKISGPSSGTAGALTLSLSSTAPLTSIDASGDNGNLTFTDYWAGAVIKGGAGNDIVTLATALTGGSITFGAGDNSLLTVPSFGSIGAGVTVDGGSSGDNTISAALVNSNNAADIKDFQILDVSGYGGPSPWMRRCCRRRSPASRSAPPRPMARTLINLAAAVTVTDTHASDNSALTLTHAGTATDSLTINFAGTSAANQEINTLTSTGDTTIAINSGGASTANIIGALNETDNHLTTITITGSQAFDLFGVSTDGSRRRPRRRVLTKIDGHAATGALDIAVGLTANDVSYTGLTILGGGGGDTITNAAANGVITEGATASTLHNVLEVSGSGAVINDQASAGTDSIFLAGVNETANLGSGGTTAASTSVQVASASSAATFADTVNFGSGIATVTDNLAYSAISTTTGNLLDLTGTLHGEILGFSNAIANTTSTLGAATAVTASNLSQAVSQAEVDHDQ